MINDQQIAEKTVLLLRVVARIFRVKVKLENAKKPLGTMMGRPRNLPKASDLLHATW